MIDQVQENELGFIQVVNASGEVIPPFAVMKVTDAGKQNGEPYLEVDKPDGSGSNYVLNGAFSIGIGGNGAGSVAFSKRAFYNNLEGTPSIGDEWGPKSGQWSLSPDGSGFVFVGDITSDHGRVRLASGSPPRDEMRCQFTSKVAAGTSGNTWPILVCKTTPTPIPLPTGTPPVTEDPLYVADVHGIGDDLTDGDWVRAVRHVGVDTYDSNDVNWECTLDGAGSGSGGGSRTYNVQLYNTTKARSDTVVEVKLLEDDLTDAGLAPVDCYDPHNEFSGGLADDAIGRATYVTDADTGETRLEFTHLRGPAAWVIATLDESMGSSSATATVEGSNYNGPEFMNEDPSDASGDVEMYISLPMHMGLESGTKVVGVLKDPDTEPISYWIVEAPGGGGDPAFDETYIIYDDENGYWTLDFDAIWTYIVANYGTNVDVITGCGSPDFVTQDESGNPVWNFATTNVRVLANNGPGANVQCSAVGLEECGGS